MRDSYAVGLWKAIGKQWDFLDTNVSFVGVVGIG